VRLGQNMYDPLAGLNPGFGVQGRLIRVAELSRSLQGRGGAEKSIQLPQSRCRFFPLRSLPTLRLCVKPYSPFCRATEGKVPIPCQSPISPLSPLENPRRSSPANRRPPRQRSCNPFFEDCRPPTRSDTRRRNKGESPPPVWGTSLRCRAR